MREDRRGGTDGGGMEAANPSRWDGQTNDGTIKVQDQDGMILPSCETSPSVTES